MLTKLNHAWQSIRQNIRQLSGEDAYERYLAHFNEHQAAHQKLHKEENAEENTAPPLSREAFFKEWQTSKWKGIKRCC